MITYLNLGKPNRGRLGNQLFQIASTIGLATKFGHDYTFPAWSYSPVFEKPLQTIAGVWDMALIEESRFTYTDEGIAQEGHFAIDGWRQSEKYFAHCKDLIRSTFKFELFFESKVLTRFKMALSRPAIAVSVRRGDFVGNQNYDQIPAKYYVLGLLEEIPDWRDYNIIFFSDDLQYCRVQFEGLPNVFFADGSDVDQLCLMTHCRHFVISNSTFSWWGAWLGEKDGSIVVRPPLNFAGPLARANSEADYWPERWTKLDFRARKIDLSDVTFTIPVFIDHRHRIENLELNVQYLQENFMTNVMVGEQGTTKANRLANRVRYLQFSDLKVFHRTKMLNDMAKLASTDIVVNWDADIFVPLVQIWLAADRIRKGDDMVYPYDGRFARVPRVWYDALKKDLDVGIFRDTQFAGKYGKPLPTSSVGGAILFNRVNFLNGGGENEFMISFGPEDWERNFRFKALGYVVSRVPGCLYHLDHWCGPNSSTRNPYFHINHKELDDMRAMTPEQLEQYVGAWPWRP